MYKEQLTVLNTCRDYKSLGKTYTRHIIRNVLSWSSQDLNITMIRYPQVKPYHFRPQTFKHVEIINVSDKPTYDTSLERS